MKVSIQNARIIKCKENEVTSSLVSIPHYKKDLDRFPYHPDGIFSKRIFGNLYKCDCGELKEEGYCKQCETRVVTYENMPDFYIQLPTKTIARYSEIDEVATKEFSYDDIEKLAKYQGFLVKKVQFDDSDSEIEKFEFVDMLDENFNIDLYSDMKENIFIGEEALNKIIDNNWINDNMSDAVLIPHTIYRPLIVNNNQTPFVSKINELYISLIDSVKSTQKIIEMTSNPLFLLTAYKKINDIKESIDSSILDEIQENKFSIVRSEVISHPITGAARATFLNRHDVNEDVILIGDTLVETLWPYLYKKHQGDMAEINRELVENNYSVLLNRPPTIAHLSIMAMKPRIASIYPLGKTEGTNGCLLQNEKYISEHPERIGKLKFSRHDNATRDDKLLKKYQLYNICDELEYGDIEEFGSGINWNETTTLTVRDELKGSTVFKEGEFGVIKIIETYIEDEDGNLFLEPNIENMEEYEADDLTDGLFRVTKMTVQGAWDGVDTLGVRSISINSIIADGLGADFDGDVLLVIALYSKNAMKEADSMLPSKAFFNYANNQIRNHIVEDFVYILNEDETAESILKQ